MPAINLATQKNLEQCSGQNIIEFGPGCGLFMAKLLAAGANHVTGIELSKNACSQIPTNIKNYELKSNSFTGKYKVINANFCNDNFKVIKDLAITYDQIVAFNVLHYLTPLEAMKFLCILPSIMHEESILTVSMNAPSGDKIFVNAYKKAILNGETRFPGYIHKTRVDTQEYEVENNQLKRMIRKTGTAWISAEPITFVTDISPSILAQSGTPSVKLMPHTKKAEVKVSLKQTAFMWDKNTAIAAFGKAGLIIRDIYYLDQTNNRHETLDLEHAETMVFNLVVVASKAKK